MKGHSFLRISVVFAVLILALGAFAETVNAALILKGVRTWYWVYKTNVTSVAWGDVDSDGQAEVVTGGYYWDGTRDVAQLCIWDGASLALEDVRVWHGTSHTYVYSVAVADVDGDGQAEVVTGGYYSDGAGYNAQLCVWSGKTLALENVRTWLWERNAGIYSVAVCDLDGDGAMEIVTGGSYNDGTRAVAQLCVWDGKTLALENVRTWLWGNTTYVYSVAVADVDGDGQAEVVTGGHYHDGTCYFAQLCVWDGGSLTLKNIQTWYWSKSYTFMYSVAVADVDGDGQAEVVTGGRYEVGTVYYAQLCVWSGKTLALEGVQSWYWTDDTYLEYVAVCDLDGDGAMEIVTGGQYYDSVRLVAQLCVWDGKTLSLENVQTWYWTASTYIWSVAVCDLDGDGAMEIVTGGQYYDSVRLVAQLCVWG